MKYFSTFSGIGGFELGIKQAYDNRPNIRNRSEVLRETMPDTQESQDRFTCVGYSEIDKYATSIYQKHFPNHKNYGDITTIIAEDLPDFDLLVGGFPCQSFSIAGKRGGFNDTRGTMFFELARILRAKQPRLFVFENVKGLLSHDGGRTFATIIQTLDELRYDVQWQIINSKNHGVPQNRERVFIIGHSRGTRRPEVFPFGDDSEAVTQLSGQHSNTLTTRYYGGQANGTYVTESKLNAQEIVQLNQPTHSNDRVYGTDGLSPTLNTMQGGNRQPFIQNPKMMNYKKDYENSVAITATSYKEPPVVNAIRRLTPTECERLQGFPDHFTKYGVDDQGQEVLISDTQRYKVLGNAVTTNVIKDIVCQLLK